MAHQVFISHSSKDKTIADAICHNLEEAECPCWIAPRDIVLGEKWPAAISKAIAKSRIMILVFSSNSNVSDQIFHELSLASKNKVIIVPFRIEQDLEPEPGIDYFLGDTHWLDAMNPPTQEQINVLVHQVKSILNPSAPPPPLPESVTYQPLPPSYAPPPTATAPGMYENIPFSEWSRYGMSVPPTVRQAEQEGKQVRQIEVDKKLGMKCPFCGTAQPARAGVNCKNSACGAFLYVSTLMPQNDPLGQKVVTYAIKKEAVSQSPTGPSGSPSSSAGFSPQAKEYLKKFFSYLVWSGTVDSSNLSATYSVLQLEKGANHKTIMRTLESWVEEAKGQAARAMNMQPKDMAFLNVNLSQPINAFPIIEDAFSTLYKAAYLSNPASAATNIATVRLAITEIVGEKRQQELVGIWNTRLR